MVTGLHTPWGIGFLPDGTALITDRDTGAISALSPDGELAEAGTVDGVQHEGEGGLLGLAVSPDFAGDHSVYVYYTTDQDNRIARLTVTDHRVGDQQDILTGIPRAGFHNGGRIAFGPDGLLYVGTGDAGNSDGAQDLGYLGGKILRITADGDPAPGNPFGDRAPLVYSYGHRNVQGLAFDDAGQLWAAEFGQSTWDELNVIEPGGNYGWPIVEGMPTDDQAGSDFVAPQRVWSTDEASPSGIAIWRGSVWMAALGGRTLWQIPLTGDAQQPTGDPVAHFVGEYGRLRTAIVAPDGSLWISTSNTDGRGSPADRDDRILRLRAP